MRALVTGCTGFIGRHAVQQLLIDGWDVDGFDVAAPQGRFETHMYGTQHRMWRTDARDFFRSDPGVTTYDLVIHAAAVVGGRAKIEGAPLDLAVDFSIDAEFFQWVVRTRPAHVVYLSSSAVYPIGLQDGSYDTGLNEDTAGLFNYGPPDQTYGWSKLFGEMLAQETRRAGINVHVIRPFSGYGQDQSLDYPFPSFINRARRKATPFPMWGDGTQVRDWIHVDDVIATMLAMVEQDHPGPLNCGTGIGTDFNTLALKMWQAAGHTQTLVVNHLRDQPRGVRYRVADVTELNELRPPQVTLEEGIRRALA